MRGHKGIVALLVAFATENSRAVAPPPTRFLIGMDSE
jgi:hypothetical protein